MSDFGLYFFNARWYDPYLNHMTQPDTIVPDPANPQAWNRYAYSFNNPLRYTDPTGHKPIIDEDKNGNPIVDPFWHPRSGGGGNSDDGSAIIDKNNWVDEWVWDNVSSAFGIHFGASGQFDTGIGAGLTPFEFLILFNWRSGQLSLFYSGEGFGYIGTPGLYGGNIYGGWTTVKGLSDNQNFEGPSLFGGLTASLDGVARGGGMLVSGMALDKGHINELPPVFFIDPDSGRPIEFHQASLTLGGNLIPNGADVGVIVGNGYSVEIIPRSIPFWPDLR